MKRLDYESKLLEQPSLYKILCETPAASVQLFIGFWTMLNEIKEQQKEIVELKRQIQQLCSWF